VYLAQALYYSGEREKAEALLQTLRQSSSAPAAARAQATLASFLAERGQREQAQRLLQAALDGGYMDHHVAYSLGATYAQWGRTDEALHRLRDAANSGFPCYGWFVRDPLLQPMRAAPAFQQFLEEVRRLSDSARDRYGGASGTD
jgi:tetratricopeptide (TPR) repeat protein